MRESLSRCDGIFTVFTRCSSSKKWWHENLSILYLSRLVGEGFRGNSKPKVALSGVHHNSRRVREKRDTTLGEKSVLNQLSSTSTLLHDVRARHKSKRVYGPLPSFFRILSRRRGPFFTFYDQQDGCAQMTIRLNDGEGSPFRCNEMKCPIRNSFEYEATKRREKEIASAEGGNNTDEDRFLIPSLSSDRQMRQKSPRSTHDQMRSKRTKEEPAKRVLISERVSSSSSSSTVYRFVPHQKSRELRGRVGWETARVARHYIRGVEQNKRQRDGIRAEAMSFSSDLTALNITYPPRNGPCFARVGLITQTQREPSVVPSSNDWHIHRPPSGCRVIAFRRHSRLPVDDQD